MNRIILLLLILVFANNADAQYLRTGLFNKYSKKVTNQKSGSIKSDKKFNQEFLRSAKTIYKAQKEYSDFWNATNQDWDSSNYVHYTYDNEGRVLSQTFVDVFTGPLSRELYTYNANGNPTSLINQAYENNIWKNFVKFSLSYNTKGTVTEELIQVWDSIGNTWVNSERESYEFNSSDDLILVTREMYNGSNWNIIFGLEIDRVYNNNLIVKETGIYFNPNTNTWDSTIRNNYSYGPHNYMTEFVSEIYNGQQEWEYYSKEIYHFNTNNVIDTAYNFAYDTISNTWLDFQRAVGLEYFNFTGDIQTSDIKKLTIQDFNGTAYINSYRIDVAKTDNFGSTVELSDEYVNNNWLPIDRLTRNYDSKLTYYELKYEEYINGAYEVSDHVRRDITYDNNNVITQFIVNELDFFTRILTPYQRVRYTDFLSFSVGLNKENQFKLKAYPNPSNSHVNITYTLRTSSEVSYSIMDVNGKLIFNSDKELMDKGEYLIKTPELDKGIYVFMLRIGSEINTLKMIITE